MHQSSGMAEWAQAHHNPSAHKINQNEVSISPMWWNWNNWALITAHKHMNHLWKADVWSMFGVMVVPVCPRKSHTAPARCFSEFTIDFHLQQELLLHWCYGFAGQEIMELGEWPHTKTSEQVS